MRAPQSPLNGYFVTGQLAIGMKFATEQPCLVSGLFNAKFMPTYYPEYEPKNREKFDEMMKFFKTATDKRHLEDQTILFILDMSYSREDILVASKRAGRELGFDIL